MCYNLNLKKINHIINFEIVRSVTKIKGKRIHDGSDAATPQRNINNRQLVLS